MRICVYDLMRCKAHYRLVVKPAQWVPKLVAERVQRRKRYQWGVHGATIALKTPIFI
jgi:hypothetical protein